MKMNTADLKSYLNIIQRVQYFFELYFLFIFFISFVKLILIDYFVLIHEIIIFLGIHFQLCKTIHSFQKIHVFVKTGKQIISKFSIFLTSHDFFNRIIFIILKKSISVFSIPPIICISVKQEFTNYNNPFWLFYMKLQEKYQTKFQLMVS